MTTTTAGAMTGAHLDRFQLEGVLGRGAEAVVYRALDTRAGKPVALKIFRKPPEDGQRREVLIQRRIRHRGVVAMQEYAGKLNAGGVGDYTVLELVEGPSLKVLPGAAGGDPRLVLSWAESVLKALAYLHGRGIVHHDIKPSNILVPQLPDGRPAGEAKLTDFGIATSASHPCTSSGYGTAHYMSPEQAAGGQTGAAGDIYALGLVILECLSGASAFPGGAIQSMLARTLRPPQVPASLGRRWAGLIVAMTAIDPTERVTAREALRLIRRIKRSGFGGDGPQPPRPNTEAG